MNRFSITYSVLAVFILLTSCNIEKRLYTGGYYISSPASVKNNIPKKSSAGLATGSQSVGKNEKSSLPVEENTTSHASPSSAPISLPQKTNSKLKNADYVPPQNIPEQKPEPIRYKRFRGDDDKVKKDVWQLLFGSIGVFLAACLYEIFLSAGILLLANIFFILTPFGIIGIWILALLLNTKYKREAELNNPDKREKQGRIITKRKAFLWAGFLGIFGAHRFYLGYTGMGILEMLTLGGFFVLWFIDLLRIKNGKLKPKKGEYDREESTYTKVKARKAPNKTQNMIKLSVLITLAALMLILGFAILF